MLSCGQLLHDGSYIDGQRQQRQDPCTSLSEKYFNPHSLPDIMNQEEPTNLMRPDTGCVCPNCDFEMSHMSYIPCHTRRCPYCGTPLTNQKS
jgi:hypothetical protein